MKHNQKGFSLIEGLFTILVITAVAFAGWYVWHSDKTDSPKASTTTTAKTTPKATTPAPAVDPTVNWTAYTSTAGKYSLRYPTTWVTAAYPQYCSEGILLLGPTAKTVGSCGSENFGEVAFFTVNMDARDSYKLTPDNYKNVTTGAVTVDGVQGQKLSGTYANADQLGGPPVGTNELDYVFFTNGKTYVAKYEQLPTSPDVSSDFNLIVTKTLKFE